MTMSTVVGAALGLAALLVTARTPQAQAPTIVSMAGARHVVALWSDGVVTTLGDNRAGQAGRPTVAPDEFVGAGRVALPRKATAVAAGERTSYAVLDDGTVWAWGDNRLGQLGADPSAVPRRATPLQVPGLEAVAEVFAEMDVAMAVVGDGTVRAWGGVPQLFAPGRRVDLGISRPLTAAGLTGVARVSGAQRYGFALTRDGRVLAWGVNALGQLGLGTTSRLEPPTAVPALSDVVSVAHGTGTGVAVTRDGRVWTWGHNGQAGLGNGQRADTMDAGEPTPRPVAGITDAVEVKGGSISGRHILVRRRTGTLVGWGNTDWGQLGTGSVAFVPTPTAVTLPGVEAYWPFGNVTFARTRDGALWFWGDGAMARALIGTRPNQRVPARVASDTLRGSVD